MAAKAHMQLPESWPIWYDGKHINEVLFCHDLLTRHPITYKKRHIKGENHEQPIRNYEIRKIQGP